MASDGNAFAVLLVREPEDYRPCMCRATVGLANFFDASTAINRHGPIAERGQPTLPLRALLAAYSEVSATGGYC
jgi:hypothetical protein